MIAVRRYSRCSGGKAAGPVARQLLIDVSHPIRLPTPRAGPAQQPTLGNGTASDTGTCGQGGSAATCARPTGALPQGALQDQTPQTQTSASGNGQGGGGNPPAGSAADCAPGGGGLGELVSGQVPYGSTVFSQMIQAERLRTNDKRGNYAVGCLEDRTIIMARSGEMHAEENLIRQAGFRRIIDLYSERAPCQENCAALTRGMNTSWSFRWNPPEVRPQSTLAFRDAMRELFQLP
jgi:hypothetical protein